MLFVVHSIVFSKLKYKILHGFAWVHLTWKRCISNGLTGSCKIICSIFMPRLGMNFARLCAKSCQNVMVSHGKSWQDLANFFHRGVALETLSNDNTIVINKADKANVIVIQNHDDYAREGFQHLGDAKVYKKLTHDTTMEVVWGPWHDVVWGP